MNFMTQKKKMFTQLAHNNLFNKYIVKKKRLKHVIFLVELLEDLYLSFIYTIFIYFVLLFTFYSMIHLNLLTDPAQSINLDNKCSIQSNSSSNIQQLEQQNDMIILTSIAESILTSKNLKYFLCYRTLFDLLRLESQYHYTNLIDICIYDPNLNSLSLMDNLLIQFGRSDLEIELSRIKKLYSKLNYSFNKILGYYHLVYGKSELYLFLFTFVGPTRLEFDSIKRYGIFYLQFDYFLNYYYKDKLRKIETNQNKSNIYDSICLLNKLPIYMLDEMEYKVIFSNTFIPMSINSYEMLMYFYPNLWWVTSKNCTI
jgi:hypothetical protein